MTDHNGEKKPFLIDGGYLSFLYGSEAFATNAWSVVRRKYSIASGGIIMMDHPEFNERVKYYPKYKSHRQQQRDEDENVMARKQRVETFRRDVLVGDPSMITVRLYGLEADDLVAAFIISKIIPDLRVIGVDKDLMQLDTSTFTMEQAKGGEITRDKFIRKLPKTLQPYVKTGRDILLCLVMLGDSSDDVPRILPSGISSLKEFATVFSHHKPFAHLVNKYGNAIKSNVYLTALPGPWVYDPIPSEMELIEFLDSPYWQDPLEWGFKLRKDIGEMFAEALERVQLAGAMPNGEFKSGLLESKIHQDESRSEINKILKELGYDTE